MLVADCVPNNSRPFMTHPRRDDDDNNRVNDPAAASWTRSTASARTGALLRRRSTATATTLIERDQQVQVQRSPAHHHHHRRRQDPVYLWSSLAAGVGSGALASLLCAPLDLVRTRLQVWGQVYTTTPTSTTSTTTSTSTSTSTTATTATKKITTTTTPTIQAIPTIVRDIVRQDGVRGLFRGLGATLLTVPAFWGVYCTLRRCYCRRRGGGCCGGCFIQSKRNE